MAPELHYQLIINRVAELHEEASNHRRANEAIAGRKAQARSSQQRLRAAFGKLRTS
ncbi:hypothetical protein [Sphaerisporangium perillae]|uniref:hypothetical protein n=1 Tax=Sphaerisporangium perillae TaxID=2935860 RepID=UPI00200ECAA1|nr:hypothetical protein [Sphaerisporangium perillae]